MATDVKPENAPDGADWARSEVGMMLRRAREQAGFSWAQLAEKLGKDEAYVSRAESGEMLVSERYLRALLKACGLPSDWNGN